MSKFVSAAAKLFPGLCVDSAGDLPGLSPVGHLLGLFVSLRQAAGPDVLATAAADATRDLQLARSWAASRSKWRRTCARFAPRDRAQSERLVMAAALCVAVAGLALCLCVSWLRGKTGWAIVWHGVGLAGLGFAGHRAVRAAGGRRRTAWASATRKLAWRRSLLALPAHRETVGPEDWWRYTAVAVEPAEAGPAILDGLAELPGDWRRTATTLLASVNALDSAQCALLSEAYADVARAAVAACNAPSVAVGRRGEGKASSPWVPLRPRPLDAKPVLGEHLRPARESPHRPVAPFEVWADANPASDVLSALGPRGAQSGAESRPSAGLTRSTAGSGEERRRRLCAPVSALLCAAAPAMGVLPRVHRLPAAPYAHGGFLAAAGGLLSSLGAAGRPVWAEALVDAEPFVADAVARAAVLAGAERGLAAGGGAAVARARKLAGDADVMRAVARMDNTMQFSSASGSITRARLSDFLSANSGAAGQAHVRPVADAVPAGFSIDGTALPGEIKARSPQQLGGLRPRYGALKPVSRGRKAGSGPDADTLRRLTQGVALGVETESGPAQSTVSESSAGGAAKCPMSESSAGGAAKCPVSGSAARGAAKCPMSESSAGDAAKCPVSGSAAAAAAKCPMSESAAAGAAKCPMSGSAAAGAAKCPVSSRNAAPNSGLRSEISRPGTQIPTNDSKCPLLDVDDARLSNKLYLAHVSSLPSASARDDREAWAPGVVSPLALTPPAACKLFENSSTAACYGAAYAAATGRGSDAVGGEPGLLWGLDPHQHSSLPQRPLAAAPLPAAVELDVFVARTATAAAARWAESDRAAGDTAQRAHVAAESLGDDALACAALAATALVAHGTPATLALERFAPAWVGARALGRTAGAPGAPGGGVPAGLWLAAAAATWASCRDDGRAAAAAGAAAAAAAAARGGARRAPSACPVAGAVLMERAEGCRVEPGRVAGAVAGRIRMRALSLLPALRRGPLEPSAGDPWATGPYARACGKAGAAAWLVALALAAREEVGRGAGVPATPPPARATAPWITTVLDLKSARVDAADAERLCRGFAVLGVRPMSVMTFYPSQLRGWARLQAGLVGAGVPSRGACRGICLSHSVGDTIVRLATVAEWGDAGGDIPATPLPDVGGLSGTPTLSGDCGTVLTNIGALLSAAHWPHGEMERLARAVRAGLVVLESKLVAGDAPTRGVRLLARAQQGPYAAFARKAIGRLRQAGTVGDGAPPATGLRRLLSSRSAADAVGGVLRAVTAHGARRAAWGRFIAAVGYGEAVVTAEAPAGRSAAALTMFHLLALQVATGIVVGGYVQEGAIDDTHARKIATLTKELPELLPAGVSLGFPDGGTVFVETAVEGEDPARSPPFNGEGLQRAIARSVWP